MAQRSVFDELTEAAGILVLAIVKLSEAQTALGRAGDAAAATGKPTDDYERLGAEIQTLMDFVAGQILDFIRKMAEDEAGSRG
jgi:hypothetical protein